MTRFVALLRGINVSGKNKIPMSELAKLCAGLGWTDVQTYIQSGNVVFSATGRSHEADLEAAIQRRFKLEIPVIVRTGKDWSRYAAKPQFPACSTEPNRVLLALSKQAPAPGAAAALAERAKDGEVVRQDGDALWIHYPGSVARSKLTPALLDRLVGSPVTARNWNTVLRLAAML